jgi:hypothetical protein
MFMMKPWPDKLMGDSPARTPASFHFALFAWTARRLELMRSPSK